MYIDTFKNTIVAYNFIVSILESKNISFFFSLSIVIVVVVACCYAFLSLTILLCHSLTYDLCG